MGDVVRVKVIEVDLKRQRIGLSMKLGDPPWRSERRPGSRAEPGVRPGQGVPPEPGRAGRGRAGQPRVKRPLTLEEQVRMLQEKFKRL